jgi:hypothetical protein
MTTEPANQKESRSTQMWQTNLLIIATFAFICAFAAVAPGVRFNAFAIFLAPAFCFARDFS